MKIAIASDHAGYDYKTQLISFLTQLGHTVQDFGTNSTESVDYPDYVHPLARSIEDKQNELGIVVCGSGNGVAITANKYPHIRAALAWLPELATLARNHNNANVLALPARFISLPQAEEIVKSFLNAAFEGGRHQKRVDKINPSTKN